jgi:hypothetical protein
MPIALTWIGVGGQQKMAKMIILVIYFNYV